VLDLLTAKDEENAEDEEQNCNDDIDNVWHKRIGRVEERKNGRAKGRKGG
jgi:hypothetical protein